MSRQSAFFLTPLELTPQGQGASAENELILADVPRVVATFVGERRPEFGATFLGALWFQSGVLVAFCRFPTHWVVKSSHPLPMQEATALNEHIHEIVRPNSMSSSTEIGTEGCAEWHVDAQAGLTELAGVLRSHFGEPRRSNPRVAQMAEAGLIDPAVYG